MNKSLQIFKSALTSVYSEMSETEWDYLAGNCKEFLAPTKSLIIEENKIQKNLFFLTSGLIRGFYIDNRGEEITIRFIYQTNWITHYSALISNTPSKYIFQALEDSHIIAIPYSVIQTGYKRFNGLEKLGRLIAEIVLKTQQKRIEEFQFLTPEERYLSFIEDFPELFNRVSITHLSTYLGIKRQSLTRIRKKLANR